MSILDTFISRFGLSLQLPDFPTSVTDERSRVRVGQTPPAPEPETTNQISLYTLFNPRARHGRIAGEETPLRNTLAGIFKSHFEQTGRNPEARRAQVENTFSLSNPNRPQEMLVVGGDGTVVPAIQAAAETIIGCSLNNVNLQQANLEAIDRGPFRSTPASPNHLIWQNLRGVSFLALGTAADLAKQNGVPPSLSYPLRYGIFERANALFPSLNLQAPSALAEVPHFLQNSVRVPLSTPVASVNGGAFQMISETLGLGIDAEMFYEGELRRTNNPNLKGLGLFINALVDIIPRRFQQNWSFDVKLTLNGQALPEVKEIGGMLVTQNTFQAGLGALPGPWGSVKVLMIPASKRGVTGLFEAIARRNLNNLGIDTLSNSRQLQLLPENNWLILKPGDRLVIEITHNNAGEAAGVMYEFNGDAQTRGSEALRATKAEIYVPPVTIPTRASTNSVAVQMHSITALERGEFIAERANQHPPEYIESLNELPVGRVIQEAPSLTQSQAVQQNASTFYPRDSLQRWARQNNIQISEIPRLIHVAHEALNRNVSENALSMEELRQWSESEAGQSRIAQLRSPLGDTVSNRFRSQGAGLVAGLACYFGVNHLLERQGINDQNHPLLHFALSTLGAHWVHQFTSAVTTPLLNLWRGLPYQRAVLQTFNAGSLNISRAVYSSSPSAALAIRHSLATTFGFSLRGLSASNTLFRTGAYLGNFFGRTVLGMGTGLMCSNISEYTLRHCTSLSQRDRNLISGAAFFLPNVASMLFGNPAVRLFSSPLILGASVIFSAGFTADLVYRSYRSN